MREALSVPGSEVSDVDELLLLLVRVRVVEAFTMPCVLRFIDIEAFSFLLRWTQTRIFFISGVVLLMYSLPLSLGY